MLNLPRLARIAADGLREVTPLAIGFVVSDDRARRERLGDLWGERPVQALLALGAAAAVLGELFTRLGPDFAFKVHVHWGAAVLVVLLSIRIRRFLFDSTRGGEKRFSDVALGVAPALLSLLLVSAVIDVVLGPPPEPRDGFADPSGVGSLFLAVTHLAGVVAVVTIAVASLCYSRNWLRAISDLAVRLFVFKLLVWITALVMIEIGIVSVIVGAIVHAITGWTIPEWLDQLADQVSYAVLLLTAYGFVVGGTWRVCRATWDELLTEGDVNVPAALEQLAKKPKEAPAPERQEP